MNREQAEDQDMNNVDGPSDTSHAPALFKPHTSVGKCPQCGYTLRVRRHRIQSLVGPYTVHDDTQVLWVCFNNACAYYEGTLDQFQRIEQRAAAVVLRQVRNPPGSVARYARKALGLRRHEFQRLLEHVQSDIVVQWETDPNAVVNRVEAMAIVGWLESVACGMTTREELHALVSETPQPAEQSLVVRDVIACIPCPESSGS